jgi:hypothetical protein
VKVLGPNAKMHSLRKLLRFCVLGIVVAVPAVALAAPGPQTVYAINCFQEKFEPRQITIACGDGAVRLAKLKWSSWSRSRARASGVYAVNRCNPSCASGHFQTYPVSITLSRPKTCARHAHRAFGRVTYTFGASRPKPAPSHTSLPCPAPPPLPPGY